MIYIELNFKLKGYIVELGVLEMCVDLGFEGLGSDTSFKLLFVEFKGNNSLQVAWFSSESLKKFKEISFRSTVER